MAKRKRLTPAKLDTPEGTPALETKAMFPSYPNGHYTRPARPAPPIADVAADSSATAALSEMAETLTRAREEGRMVLRLPLEEIKLDYLVRDRIAVEDAEMSALVESLRARGQQTPIEVAALGDDRYGLISGWRRCHALKRLYDETGNSDYSSVLALLRRPDQSADAYLAMVEENEIRVGLSYYERARIVAKAVEQGVYPAPSEALRGLFQSASRAKRSKIKSFLVIVDALDGQLQFPEALSERAGLALAAALEANQSLKGRIRDALASASAPDARAELDLILAASGAAPRADRAPAPKAAPDPGTVEEPAPGVRLKTQGNGALTLSGPGVDAGLRADLLAWLAARAG